MYVTVYATNCYYMYYYYTVITLCRHRSDYSWHDDGDAPLVLRFLLPRFLQR